MKKLITIVLSVLLCCAFISCSKSEAVIEFESLVKLVGTVSLNSEEDIVAAENAYNNLTAEEKVSVADSYALLSQQRTDYERLVAEEEQKAIEAQKKAEIEARLASVKAVIDAIGDVTLDSKASIVKAEKAYEALAEEEKNMISDYAKKLAQCRADYEAAVAKEKAAHAAEVSAAIDAIGTVTLDSKEKISAARRMYDALTNDEKKLVTNENALSNAESTYATLLAAENQRIIDEYSKKFEIDADPVEGINWYIHKDMPDYIDVRPYIIPYIGVRGNQAWICIRYNYTDDDWIFWKTLTIMVDGKKYYKSFSYFDIVHDNGGGDVWEWYDEALNINQAMDSTQLTMLKEIGNSKETIVRFQGDDYHYDLYVTDTDKQIIRDALALYEALLK